MGKRRQPLSIVITTAGSDRSSLWIRLYTYSAQVAQGVLLDDAHFSMIFEVDSEDVRDEKGMPRTSFDPECFGKANPNLGISVQPDFLVRFAKRAEVDPVVRQDLLRYHLNTRVRDALKVISPAQWAKGCGTLPDLKGRRCRSALDFGWRDDLAAYYQCFPLENNRFALRGWSWIPRHGNRYLLQHPWAEWITAGHVIATDGTATAVDDIEAFVLTEVAKGYVLSVCADPSNARAPLQHLATKVSAPEFDQTHRNYNEAIREFLKALSEGRILHGDDPVLSWAADNLVLKQNSAGLVMPDKLKADEKIDPLVAALMAFASCLYTPDTGQQEYRVRWL
jgi:phage terminase large subunit-like protein